MIDDDGYPSSVNLLSFYSKANNNKWYFDLNLLSEYFFSIIGC
jgi:hypothetical protein